MIYTYAIYVLITYTLIVYLLSLKVFIGAWKKTDSKIHRVWLARIGAITFFLMMPLAIPFMFLVACFQELKEVFNHK